MTSDPERTRTLVPVPIDDPALEAGLAIAFGDRDGTESRLVHNDAAGHESQVESSSDDLPRGGSDRYEWLGEIARGGMGVILKGRDPHLRRDLAVKVLKTELVTNESTRQRFVEEARVTGQLQHPGVVPIYDLGRAADGRPFFAMKLVKGDTLADQLSQRPDPAADRGRFLKIFEQVCHAVAYAHSKRVIHRDLKPANIMVGAFGEVQVMDWGLAKVLPPNGDAAAGRAAQANRERERPEETTVIMTDRRGSGAGSETQPGLVMGTPAFMPPEQAAGEVDKVDERADVFGLGAMLCVILTGQPPYVADTAEATRLMAIRSELADALARLAECGADRELVELCRECLTPDLAARPRNAKAVADAVSAYLASVEERAHRAEVERAAAVARVVEERKRRRMQWALAAAILLILAAATWFVTDRSARAKELDRAWAEAERLLPATANGPPAQRLATTRAALTAARTAESDFGLGVGSSELRDRVRRTITRLEDQERDLEVLIDLDAAWLQQAEHTAEKRSFEPALAAPLYAEAFRKAGIDVLGGDPNEAASAIRRRTGLQIELCDALEEWATTMTDEAAKARLTEVARLADPDSPRSRLKKLIQAKDSRGIAEFLRTQEPRSLPPTVAVNLARQLWLNAKWPNQAAALLRAVHDQKPNDFWVNVTLGQISGETDPPRTDDLIRYLTAALAVRPDVPVVYTVLGYTFLDRGRNAEAMACFRRAVALNNHCFRARIGLIRNADPAERAKYVGELEKLARDLPEDVGVQTDLGEMYLRQKRFELAAEQLRKVTVLAPRSPASWAYLGDTLKEMGQTTEAGAAFREAYRIAPGHADFRNRLLNHLKQTGAAAEELQVFKRWYDRLSADDPQRPRWAPQLKYLERQAELERRLPDFREGRAEPDSAEEALISARLCLAKKLYLESARFYAQAFESKPALADGVQIADRYNAACAAVRAASEAGPGDVQARFRKQALDWLRADLATRTSRAKSDTERTAFRKFLRDTVQPDPDLSGVRSFWALTFLPTDERAEWMKFWSEVEAAEKAMRPPVAGPRPQEVQ